MTLTEYVTEKLQTRYKRKQRKSMIDLYVRTFIFIGVEASELKDHDIIEAFNALVNGIKESTDTRFVKRYLLFIANHIKNKRLEVLSTIPDPANVENTDDYVAINWRLEAELWRDRRPQGYANFQRFAKALKDRNRRFGINLLRERVRWETVYEYGDDRYKFCNTLSPYIARMLIEEDPSLGALIRCKKTKW